MLLAQYGFLSLSRQHFKKSKVTRDADYMRVRAVALGATKRNSFQPLPKWRNAPAQHAQIGRLHARGHTFYLPQEVALESMTSLHAP